MIRIRRHMFTAVGLSLAAVLAISGCSSAVQNQDVPSAGDDKGTSTPTPEITSGATIPKDDVEAEEPAENVPGAPTSLLELPDYFGIVPEEVEVPQEVKDQFPTYNTLVRYVLTQQLDASSLQDLQVTPTGESRDLYAVLMDQYLSGDMQTRYREAMAGYADEEGDNYRFAFTLTPLAPSDGLLDVPQGSFKIDDTRLWNIDVRNVVVENVTTPDGITGVNVSFDRQVIIPIDGQEFDIAIMSRQTFFVIPGVDDSWVIDGIAAKYGPPEQVNR